MPEVASPPPVRVLFRIGTTAITVRILATAVFVVLGFIGLVFLQRHLDLAQIHTRAQALPGLAVIAAISVLPLLGFPVSVLHLVAGVRFGFLGGIGVVAVTGIVQHVLGWVLVRFLPARLLARLAPWRDKLAGNGHLDATLICCLIPGMPYTLPLYLLPALGVPFPLLFGLAPLIHTARALVTILLGEMSDDLTPMRLFALTVYYLVLFVLSGWLLRHLAPISGLRKPAEAVVELAPKGT